MKFIDEATIEVRAGKGGDGAVHFHRAAFVPKGGPDGGDGGRGGSVVLCASMNVGTLSDVALKRVIGAQDGRPGGGSRMSGRAGADITIDLPVGTVLKDSETGEILADLALAGESLVLYGGDGGRGNARFATPSNRTPRRAEPGRPGESRRLHLELKLLADVGLIGRPNAGKSTLLKALTAASPQVGDYPFTTLTPNLGVVMLDNFKRFTIADIPGLIEGARFGRGLGGRFLRHVERTNLLVVLIDSNDANYRTTLDGLLKEIGGYSAELMRLPRIIVRSKSDLPRASRSRLRFDLEISSFSGEGLGELVDILARRLGVV